MVNWQVQLPGCDGRWPLVHICISFCFPKAGELPPWNFSFCKLKAYLKSYFQGKLPIVSMNSNRPLHNGSNFFNNDSLLSIRGLEDNIKLLILLFSPKLYIFNFILHNFLFLIIDLRVTNDNHNTDSIKIFMPKNYSITFYHSLRQVLRARAEEPTKFSITVSHEWLATQLQIKFLFPSETSLSRPTLLSFRLLLEWPINLCESLLYSNVQSVPHFSKNK